MSQNDILDKIIYEVTEFKDKGNTHVSIDSLIKHLETAKEQSPQNHDFSLETFKAQQQINIEALKINEAIRLESFKSTIAIGINAAKSCMLINGGASVALLAFIGNIWSKGSLDMAALLVSKGLLMFCIGVFLAAGCSGFTYLAQSCFTRSSLGTMKKWQITGHSLNFIAIVAGFLSLAAFGAGSYQTYLSMVSQFASH